MKPTLLDKLEQLQRRASELDALLAAPDCTADMQRYRSMTRELAELQPVVNLYAQYQARVRDLSQAEMLLSDMQSEYEKGNYCICGGDFNKDLLGNSEEVFGISAGDYTWAQPLPEELFRDKNITLVPPLDPENPVPSCRNADAPYHEGQYVVTVDGFLVSDNVTVNSATVIDTGFAYSDHNPVTMTFTLQP